MTTRREKRPGNRASILKLLIPVLVIVLVAFPLVFDTISNSYTSTNEPLCPGSQVDCRPDRLGLKDPLYPVPRARMQYEDRDDYRPSVFVGLALSGGGSRTANFSMAVMEQLKKIGILEYVSAISSTSGGGLAAAYYSLFGPELDWSVAKEKMQIDLLSKWGWANFYPQNLALQIFTNYDRSDVMAEILDKQLFDGATFANLGPHGRASLFG